MDWELFCNQLKEEITAVDTEIDVVKAENARLEQALREIVEQFVIQKERDLDYWFTVAGRMHDIARAALEE